MKRLTILFSILLLSIAAKAQEVDSIGMSERLYVGISLNGRYFLVDYENRSTLPENSDYFMAKPYLYLGYRLSERIQLEVGVAYANDKDHDYSIYIAAPNHNIEYHNYAHSRAIMFPIKLNHTFFDFYKNRLAIYGFGSFIPVYSGTKIRKEEVSGGIATITYSSKASGFNTFTSFGVGAKYVIWKRFLGYSEINLFNYNLSSGRNIDPWSDVRRKDRPLSYLSYGLGVNYNLKDK